MDLVTLIRKNVISLDGAQVNQVADLLSTRINGDRDPIPIIMETINLLLTLPYDQVLLQFQQPDKESFIWNQPATLPLEKQKQEENLIANPDPSQMQGQTCPACQSINTEFSSLQVSRGDEATSAYYKCNDCEHVWRR